MSEIQKLFNEAWFSATDDKKSSLIQFAADNRLAVPPPPELEPEQEPEPWLIPEPEPVIITSPDMAIFQPEQPKLISALDLQEDAVGPILAPLSMADLNLDLETRETSEAIRRLMDSIDTGLKWDHIFAKLPISILNIAPNLYQRVYREASVRKMVREYDPDALSVCTVGLRRDKLCWLVDGGHRRELMIRIGESHLLCKIFLSDGPEHEARVYEKVSRHAQQKKMEIFKAKVGAKEPAALEIVEIAESCGYRIDVHDRYHTWPYLRAVGAFEAAYRRGVLEDVLDTLQAAWHGDYLAVQAPIINGVASVIARHKNIIDMKRLRKVLKKETPASVKHQFALRKNIKEDNKKSGTDMYVVIRALYNSRLNDKNKLP